MLIALDGTDEMAASLHAAINSALMIVNSHFTFIKFFSFSRTDAGNRAEIRLLFKGVRTSLLPNSSL